ncbi:MAG TPA: PDZ domain-containing protein [Thermoanaerobaculia bacterium]|jgi:membrane-associated protease RseP (regulator of RpoE activity)|nr:PDZ domain-containing protein [Thermoanaerobaculia bacterium]
MSARFQIAALSLLLVLPTASRLRASDDPATPPPTPEKKESRKKMVIVDGPRRIVADEDGVFMEGDGDESDFFVGDLQGLDEELPRVLRMHGFGGGYIGVQPIDMTEELREHFGAPKDAGILVGKVYADEPAAKAGLKVGDIVTSVDGAKIASTRDLVRAIRRKKDGETVSVAILRDRSAKTLTVAIAERKGDVMQMGELGPEMRRFRREFHAPRPPRPPMPPDDLDSPELRQRMDDLEKRLHDLESRLPKKQSL